MNMSIRIEMDGPDQWTLCDSSHGQTVSESHCFIAEFKDPCEKLKSLASMIQRIISAINPPRKVALLAEILRYESESDLLEQDERKLCELADKICWRWEDQDKDLDERIKENRHGN